MPVEVMRVVEVDPSDAVAFREWFEVMHSSAVEGRTAPLVWEDDDLRLHSPSATRRPSGEFSPHA